MCLEQTVEVVGLHYHIVELKEGKTLFHSLLVALCSEHIVDREAGTDLAENFHVVKVKEPIGVINHFSLAFAELNETLHLLFEALAVVSDSFLCHH